MKLHHTYSIAQGVTMNCKEWRENYMKKLNVMYYDTLVCIWVWCNKHLTTAEQCHICEL